MQEGLFLLFPKQLFKFLQRKWKYIAQRVEYLPYGEVFLERHGGDNHSMPHKFNGRSAFRDAFETTWRKKELDI